MPTNPIESSNQLTFTRLMTMFRRTSRAIMLTMFNYMFIIRIERVPFSGRRFLAFKSPKIFSSKTQKTNTDNFIKDLENGEYGEKGKVLPSIHDKTLRVASIACKLGQGMHEMLGLKRVFNIVAYESNNDSNPVWTVGRQPDYPWEISQNTAGFRRSRADQMTKTGWFRTGYSTNHLEGLEWKVNVIESPTSKNAMITPSNHIVIYSEALNCSDDELAHIIGHEMGHVIGQHSLERHTWRLPNQILNIIINLLPLYLFSLKKRARFEDIIKNFIRRRREFEADYIGMMLMASVGYDPKIARKLLRKYKYPKSKYGTHPSARRRIAYLKNPKLMKPALDLYRGTRSSNSRDQVRLVTRIGISLNHQIHATTSV